MGMKMNKFFVLFGAVLAVSACAHDYDCDMEGDCQEEMVAPAPMPAPVAQPVYNNCGSYTPSGCQGEIRTVREPVEVVYKRTTYGTVYEPRHFQNVAYERQSVNGYAAPVNGYNYAPRAQKYYGPTVMVPARY